MQIGWTLAEATATPVAVIFSETSIIEGLDREGRCFTERSDSSPGFSSALPNDPQVGGEEEAAAEGGLNKSI